MDQVNTEILDAETANWTENPEAKHRAQLIFEAISRTVTFNNSMDVLDYGCGAGYLTLLLAPLVKTVTGVDSSSAVIQMLQHRTKQLHIKNVKTVNTDFQENTFAKLGSFDLAVSVMTLHHINNPEMFADTLFKQIKDEGHIVLADLDREDGSFHGNMPGVYHSGFGKEKFERLLLDTGFEKIQVETVYSINKNDKTYPVLMATGKKP